MNERPLFDVDRTTHVRCEVCGAVRSPLEDKAPACTYDANRDGPRPKGCLNAHDPAHAPFPEGF